MDKQLKPEELLADLPAESSKISAITVGLSKTLQFQGKSLFEWRNELRVEIPQEFNYDNYKIFITSLATNIQRSSGLYNFANSLYSIMTKSSKMKHQELQGILLERYLANKDGGRVPSQAKLQELANNPLQDTISMIATLKVVRDFFQEQRDNLVELRKTTEPLGYILNIEYKMETS